METATNVPTKIIPTTSVDQNEKQEMITEDKNLVSEKPNIAAKTNIDQPNQLFNIPNTKIHYYPLNNIGQGATSTVYLGSCGDDDFNISAAVKLIKPTGKTVHKKELQIWKHLLNNKTETSINILRLFDWGQYENIVHNFQRKETIYVLAMELANCNLRQYILENPEKDLKHLKSLCFGMSSGLEFLHKNDILHRYIKPENVLIFQNDQNTIAKLGDFRFSSILNKECTTSVISGTEVWMPPEGLEALHNGTKFKGTKAVDIFSLGMTIYFTLSKGEHPFARSEKYGRFPEMNIKDPEVLPSKLPDNLKYTETNLVEMMMNKNPEDRPIIKTVLNHPMFWSTKKSLEYICYIARTNNDKFEPKCEKLRREVEEEYQQFHKKFFPDEQLNWLSQIDSRLLSRKGKGRKNYIGSMIMSLVELIRDKREHHKDMISELMTERFSTDDEFCEEKYMEYFMNLFPQVVQFLYTSFTKTTDSSGLWTDDNNFDLMTRPVNDAKPENDFQGPSFSKRARYDLKDDLGVDTSETVENAETIQRENLFTGLNNEQNLLLNKGHSVVPIQIELENTEANVDTSNCNTKGESVVRTIKNSDESGRSIPDDEDEVLSDEYGRFWKEHSSVDLDENDSEDNDIDENDSADIDLEDNDIDENDSEDIDLEDNDIDENDSEDIDLEDNDIDENNSEDIDLEDNDIDENDSENIDLEDNDIDENDSEDIDLEDNDIDENDSGDIDLEDNDIDENDSGDIDLEDNDIDENDSEDNDIDENDSGDIDLEDNDIDENDSEDNDIDENDSEDNDIDENDSEDID